MAAAFSLQMSELGFLFLQKPKHPPAPHLHAIPCDRWCGI